VTPQRIQLSRRKGWRLPENTVVVSRPSKWGNPFRAERIGGQWFIVDCDTCGTRVRIPKPDGIRDAKQGAVRLFRAYLNNDGTQAGAIRDDGGATLKLVAITELRGKNLACWCKPGEPCHADVLLELANAPEGGLKTAEVL
jgi:hypothetical protein